MPEEIIIEALTVVAKLLEIIGAIILLLGFIIAPIRWFHQSVLDREANAVLTYRRALGRTVLIGLELLVAATIIKTITVKPTIEGMGLLVLMVAIRTTLGWTTFLETSGRWRWQTPRT